uniref:Uncharacterized protein n=1 Tax=Ascaris lumbricoides TaxID=6252 RepID=A0A0M3I1T2_ASCLU
MCRNRTAVKMTADNNVNNGTQKKIYEVATSLWATYTLNASGSDAGTCLSKGTSVFIVSSNGIRLSHLIILSFGCQCQIYIYTFIHTYSLDASALSSDSRVHFCFERFPLSLTQHR